MIRRSVASFSIAVIVASVARAAEPTEAECVAFGKAIEKDVIAGDGVAFADHFDMDAFLTKAFRNVQARDAKDIKTGVRQSFGATMQALPSRVPKGSTFTFLHHRKSGELNLLTCRIAGGQGINYWEFVVEPAPDSTATTGPTLKFDDLFTASTGEMMSQTMQRMVLRATAKSGQPLTQADVNDMNGLKAFMQSAQSGDWATAKTLYDAVPERLRKDKSVQVLRLVVAGHFPEDPAMLDAAAADFRQHFGDDPAGDLMLFDSYATRQQFDQCDECLDRLDKSVGGDPFLGTMAVNVRVNANDLPGAKAQAEKWQARYPTSRDGIESMMQVALAAKDFDAVKHWMEAMESSPDFRFHFADDLNNAKAYDAFKQSPQYQAWLAARKAK